MVRVKNDRRTKVSNVDYEKGAVVYQTLFVRKKNVHAIKVVTLNVSGERSLMKMIWI